MLRKIAVFAALAALSAFAETAIVKDGQACAKIVIGNIDGSVRLDPILPRTPQANAERLRQFIEKSTGASLEICEGTADGSRIVLEVAKPDILDIEGFSIDFPAEGIVKITGGSPRGLEYGVNEFLERFVGVRWLFPGETGTVVPARRDIIAEGERIEQKPSFYRRFLAGGSHRQGVSGQYCQWEVECRGAFHERFNVPHNMWRLIHVKKYGKTHPEFFPVYGGERYIPEEDNDIRWNHCYTAEGLAEAVAAEVGNSKMVSLCVNDGGHHCECEKCLAVDGNKKNYIGLQNRSKSYLLFCNKVARLCPNTLFAFDAYSEMAEPPEDGLILEKNLVPVITYDTYQWLDAKRRDFNQGLFMRWSKISPGGVGWYDYIYGNGYVFPRIYTHFLAENIKYLHRNGVRYFQGEYYPNGNWLDCIKGYVVFRLLWDVTLDPDDIIDDWCRACVGDEAAPLLKEFYGKIEAFWMAPAVRKTHWFREHTYLNWTDASILEALPEATIEELSVMMDKIVAAAPGNPRATLLRDEYMKMKPCLLLYKTNQRLREEADKYDFSETVVEWNFNEGSRGWSTWQQFKENGKFIRSETDGRDGTGTVGIVLEGARKLGLCYLGYMDTIPEKLYKVTAWHNAIGMTPTSKVTISVRYQKDGKWMDPSLNSENDHAITEVDAGWTKTDIYVKAPAEQGVKMVILLQAGKANNGKVFFDDVCVKTCK